MVSFNEEEQDKRLDDFQKKEEETLVELLAEKKYGIPSIDLSRVVVENEALRVLPEKEARRIEVAPFKLLGKQIHIAVKAPARSEVRDLVKHLKEKGFIPFVYMASGASLEKAWERYQELSFAVNSRAGGLDVQEDAIQEIHEKIKTISDIKALVEDVQKGGATQTVSRLLEILLGSAISIGASDIHIEPEKERIRIRYRLDGILQDVISFPTKDYHLFDSRIKLLSGLKLTTAESAQDGRFSIFLNGDEINIRTSVLPGAYGESIVLRILDPKSIRVDFTNLGIETKLFSVLDKEIHKPNGLMLITGPTGSGKTTTLYAFLQRIYSSEIKIITIEDPVEYHLDGISQTQVEDEKGFTFLEGLRAALRQDPDVIMVGEIRDEETAKIAINAALTGHLVLSTLHTNNAAGVIPRLIDLKINPKILTSALTISVAQRLVRKLCEACKQKTTPTAEEHELLTTILTQAKNTGKDMASRGIIDGVEFVTWKAVGCEKCHMIGYKGRIGIYEAIKTDDAIEKIVNENPSEREIKKIAQTQGLLSMREDGVVKILTGLTTVEEVSRVVDLSEE